MTDPSEIQFPPDDPDKKPGDNAAPQSEGSPDTIDSTPEIDAVPPARVDDGTLDPNIAQRQASDPKSSVVVTASAGTGKTKVLTDRVLRLMLDGASPDQVLCLTFTKAAASLMKTRIREELSRWTTCDDAELVRTLTDLEGAAPDARRIKRARRMFAEFLDNDNMRIMTIHAFARSLIQSFPAETGIASGFKQMDEQDEADLLRESVADVLRDVQATPGTPLAKAVHMITPELNEDDFESLIGQLTSRRGKLLHMMEQHGGLDGTIDAVFGYLGADRKAEPRKMFDDLNSDWGLSARAIDVEGLREALADLRSIDAKKALSAWLNNPELRQAHFDAYAEVFLTKEGSIRKKLYDGKSLESGYPALYEEAQRLFDGLEEIQTVRVGRGTESILRLMSAILEKYGEKKRAQNLLDFDDLVYRTNVMMAQDNNGSWVLQKMLGNLRHVLVDEAQDTNRDQWTLIGAVVKAIFENPLATAPAKDNTFFGVGDEKQSIFGFQGADPEEFGRYKKNIAEIVTRAGGTFNTVEMDIAFRSSPAITRFVDAVFENPDAADGLFFKEEADTRKVRHNPFRKGQAGLVEIHPVIRGHKEGDATPWPLPLEMHPASNPAADMAAQIAEDVRKMLDSSDHLESRGRPVHPGDIMILVRRRSDFVDDMIRELQKRDIPVAGADRMSLREHIVVMDLVALGEIVLFPRDDNKLASILKSPLIGMTEKELEDLAIGRPGSLWDALKNKAENDTTARRIYAETFAYLSGLKEHVNDERPYEFYSNVMMNACPAEKTSGLYAIYGRLGVEADDPMVEFMNAIERFEKTHVPSLQGFLSWLTAGEAEVKREISFSKENSRVQIMTVHGAKGLEAPIVIMPDTTGIPSDNTRARPRFLWPMDDRTVPLWVPKADLENSAFVRERRKIELETDREYRRLLYVALTRAADRLYVYGSKGDDKVSEKSWYHLIQQGVGYLEGDFKKVDPTPSAAFNEAANDNGGEAEDTIILDHERILRFKTEQTAPAHDDGRRAMEKKKPVSVPAWANKAPSADQRPREKFRPSEYNAAAAKQKIVAPSPLGAEKEAYYIQLGNVVHELFELLPSLPAARRDDALREYLAKPAWNITPRDQQETASQISGILNHPVFGILFGPQSRPEVPISGRFVQDGQVKEVNGKIDRLLVTDSSVTIVDFKNAQKVPEDASGVSFRYTAQMAAYRLLLRQIYPDKEIRAALLYTREAKLLPLPSDALDRAVSHLGLQVYTQKPQGPGKIPGAGGP